MSKRILVVEDNSATRVLIEDMLAFEGFEVSSVSNGPSALTAIAAGVDLVILDVMMPGMDGLSVLREIRAQDENVDLPVIMLTALDDTDSTWAGWRAGCNYYMNKPFDPDNLVSVVRQLMGVNA